MVGAEDEALSTETSAAAAGAIEVALDGAVMGVPPPAVDGRQLLETHQRGNCSRFSFLQKMTELSLVAPWLAALSRAVNPQFPQGIEDQRLNRMADDGCQSTSLAFIWAWAAIYHAMIGEP